MCVILAHSHRSPDISPMNVLSEMEDEDCLKDVEINGHDIPSLPIMDANGHPVYCSTELPLELSGVPILADFGQMLPAERCTSDTLELIEGRNLFDPIDHINNQYVLPLALAQYIGYLGPPPLEMIQKSPLFSTYFDKQGNWASEPPIPQTSLEEFVTTISPGEEKDQFLRFIRKLLTWDPEVRATTNEIYPDEWLMRSHEDMW
ncbi:predicted protein [Uncinocarpus reesii 1704]|uniref:Protein kinase domain-containing protein n=1 Tax=Uncinocarpus reesii (strain UAMH 1704) TaxID=336963 RepID=C4JWM6_UNCRE|nr:uncharacterized protein UREG_06968 [Uncinocarpus reesii 1704]EEP82103.1 predicted protein [Uncinocarpus reesii 1704]